MATPLSAPNNPAAGDLPAWLRLAHTRGLSAAQRLSLLRELGPPDGFLAGGAAPIARLIGDQPATALLAADPWRDEAIAAALRWQAQPDCHLLTLADSNYPRALLQLPDPPLVLYVRGCSLSCLNLPCLAIVGSRHATRGGQGNARSFARSLSEHGLAIVSGLAQGIDAAAHEGAMSTPDGATIAVMGTGIDRVYPSVNRALAHEIVNHGALLTELPIGSPPARQHFPQRNRLIAALGAGVLVVEAARQSGSLITARLAGDLGREVFAIPGSIHSPQSRGCHQLIRQGAKLVESATDILEELPLERPATRGAVAPPAPAGDDDPFLAMLGWDPVSVDSLMESTGLGHADVAEKLLALELSGQLERLVGGNVQRVAPPG